MESLIHPLQEQWNLLLIKINLIINKIEDKKRKKGEERRRKKSVPNKKSEGGRRGMGRVEGMKLLVLLLLLLNWLLNDMSGRWERMVATRLLIKRKE